jgi:hypothetical protein
MDSKHKRSRRPRLLYNGFGFPVVLLDVPVVRVRGVWTPDVNLKKLERKLLGLLSSTHALLTGHQIRFIRHALGMTLVEFARRFEVKHPAVIKWEKARDKPTRMKWAIEKDIRLEIARSLLDTAPAAFVKKYEDLEDRPSTTLERVSLTVGA